MGLHLLPGALIIDYYKQINVLKIILKFLAYGVKFFWVYYAYWKFYVWNIVLLWLGANIGL